jgi:TatD DNase family protein
MFFVDCHTHSLDPQSDVLRIVNLLDDAAWQHLPDNSTQCFSVGYHPWYVDGHANFDELRQRLKAAAQHQQVVAIGECGLDKLRGASWELQMNLFQMHISISEKFHKPLIIHCVRYFNEIISLRKKLAPSQPWIFHGFNGSSQMVAQAVEAGCYVSLGCRHPESFKKIVRTIPIDRLFFETDDGDSSVELLYRQAAVLLEMELSQLKEMVWMNYVNVFKNR